MKQLGIDPRYDMDVKERKKKTVKTIIPEVPFTEKIPYCTIKLCSCSYASLKNEDSCAVEQIGECDKFNRP